MEALTLAGLRSLARLHRAGVDGATERLRTIACEAHEALPVLLGFPAKNIERLLAVADPVALLVATIENAPRVARAARARVENDQARRIADEMACLLELDALGNCEVPFRDLGLLVRLGDHQHVAFGDRGAVETRHLRAVLRACRHVSTCSVVVREGSLDIRYQTALSRGLIRLRLSRGASDDVLVVRLPTRPVLPIEVATPVVIAASSDRGPQVPRLRSFGKHLAAALVAAAFGGTS